MRSELLISQVGGELKRVKRGVGSEGEGFFWLGCQYEVTVQRRPRLGKLCTCL